MIATAIGQRLIAPILILLGVSACSSKESNEPPPTFVAGRGGTGAEGGLGGGTGGTGIGGNGAVAGLMLSFGGATACKRQTCAELGVACGAIVDELCGGEPIQCADEGLKCGPLEVCIGGPDKPAKCETSFGPCEVCSAIPKCPDAAAPTRLTGRVVTPGRTDADTMNQVGVPNAVVYILRSTDLAEVPPITTGIPMGGTSCDRCEDQNLGPTLIGTVTDATGRFTLEGSIPVGVEFLLVVKAGKFRRAVKHTLPASAACTTTELPSTLPDNPTRLARTMADGVAVNIPAIAVSTGKVDAMECVLEKMGLDHALFGNPVALGAGTPRVHLFRGSDEVMGRNDPPEPAGAYIDAMTPPDSELYGSLPALQTYDFVIADCEGTGYDDEGVQREASGANVREYVNRGGRLFSSHLGYTWLSENGTAPFAEADPIATGLSMASEWATPPPDGATADGIGAVAVGRPRASPRIQNFADWLASETVITPPMNTFDILQPRSQSTGVGEFSEEFVFLENRTMRTQQFSFNTPYGAPEDQVCGRVAYSGFHVAAVADTTDPFEDAVFPTHCTGSLTAQEKVLLYMIFDLGACIGELPPPPACEPETCESTMTVCGYVSDGCGNVEDCGPCPPPR